MLGYGRLRLVRSHPVYVYGISGTRIHIPEGLVGSQALRGVDKVTGQVVAWEDGVGDAGYMDPWDFLLQNASDLRQRQGSGGMAGGSIQIV